MQSPDPGSGGRRDDNSVAPACSESKKPPLSLAGSNLSMDWQTYRTELDGHQRLSDSEVRAKIRSGEFVKLPETAGISVALGQGIRLEVTKKYLFIYEPQSEGETPYRKPLSAIKKLPAPVRQALRSSSDGTYVMNAGREYCTKELRDLLVQLGKEYHQHGKSKGEDWKLEITSGFRSTDYQSVLRMVNGNASSNSPHPTGAAVDISYKNMTADQRAWIQEALRKREESGTIEATKEGYKQCYHFVAFKGPCSREVQTGAPATPEQISQKDNKKETQTSTGSWWQRTKDYFSRFRLYGPTPPILEPEKASKTASRSTLEVEPRLESRIQFWDNVFSKYTKNITIFMDGAHPWVTFDIRAYDPKKPYARQADKQIRMKMISSVLADLGEGTTPTFSSIEKDLRREHAAVQKGEAKEFENDLRKEKRRKPKAVAARIDKARRSEFAALLREENEIFESNLTHHKESFGKIKEDVKKAAEDFVNGEIKRREESLGHLVAGKPPRSLFDRNTQEHFKRQIESRNTSISAEDRNKAFRKYCEDTSERVKTQTGRKEDFDEAVSRARPLLPKVARILEKGNIPPELEFIPFAESGYNNSAVSGAKAIGLWQIMRDTGSPIMRVNDKRKIDERYDPIFSTRAAVRILTDNYFKVNDGEALKSWPLVATGYNTGDQRMRNAVSKLRTRSMSDVIEFFQDSRFGFDGRNYFAEIVAANRVYNRLPHSAKHAPADSQWSDFSEIKLGRETTISRANEAFGSSLSDFLELNPAIRYTPPPPPPPVVKGRKSKKHNPPAPPTLPEGFVVRVPKDRTEQAVRILRDSTLLKNEWE